jgi:uncharacterized protein YbaP (TraB family)
MYRGVPHDDLTQAGVAHQRIGLHYLVHEGHGERSGPVGPGPLARPGRRRREQADFHPGKEAGADRAIIGAAGQARQRAFETAAQQVGFFADLSDTAQREYLIDTVNSVDEDAEGIDALSGAWERGDLDQLETLVLNDFRQSYPELFQVIFTQRNHAWTDTLMQELDGAGVDFVAVGAGHLLGEDGLIELLRARGVSVERLE